MRGGDADSAAAAGHDDGVDNQGGGGGGDGVDAGISECLRNLNLQRASLAQEWRRGAHRIATLGAAFAQTKIDALAGAAAAATAAANPGASAVAVRLRGKPAARQAFARPVRKKPLKKP